MLIEAHAAQYRTGQPVTARPVERNWLSSTRSKKPRGRNRRRRCRERQRRRDNSGVERTNDGDRDLKTAQELGGEPGIFRCDRADLGIRPEVPAYVGGEPEAIDAEREHEKRGALDAQPPIGCLLAEESDRARQGGSIEASAVVMTLAKNNLSENAAQMSCCQVASRRKLTPRNVRFATAKAASLIIKEYCAFVLDQAKSAVNR